MLRKPIHTVFFLLAVSLFPISQTAIAKTKAVATRPVIQTLSVNQSEDLSPGTDLVFTLEGTPKSRASLRIAGIPRTIPMKEIDSGVYEAHYTIKKKDRIAPNAVVRASLSHGKYTTVGQLGQPLVAGAVGSLLREAPRAAPGPVAIDRFTLNPVSRMEPGTELVFTVTGTPAAKATYSIEGVGSNLPLNEVKPGVYEGRYTLRRQDTLPSSANIVATLQKEGQTARSRLDQPLVNDREPPALKNVSPKDGDTVSTSGTTGISGTWDDASGSGVDAKTVKISLDGKDITSHANVTAHAFNYSANNLAVGTHRVEVYAKDYGGNAMRTSWAFVAQPQASAAGLTLEVLSPSNNAQISGGAVPIKGRTAPNATVEVQAQATASVGGLFGLTQKVFNQTVKADNAGNFVVSFNPPVAVPGARYEVTLTATKDNQSKETKLTLLQK